MGFLSFISFLKRTKGFLPQIRYLKYAGFPVYDDTQTEYLSPGEKFFPIFLEELKNIGIKCEVFNPFRPVLTAIQNNRDHRKITIIDGKAAWSLTLMFLEMWELCCGIPDDIDCFFPKNEVDERIESDGFVQPYSDSPVDNENVGEHV